VSAFGFAFFRDKMDSTFSVIAFSSSSVGTGIHKGVNA